MFKTNLYLYKPHCSNYSRLDKGEVMLYSCKTTYSLSDELCEECHKNNKFVSWKKDLFSNKMFCGPCYEKLYAGLTVDPRPLTNLEYNYIHSLDVFSVKGSMGPNQEPFSVNFLNMHQTFSNPKGYTDCYVQFCIHSTVFDDTTYNYIAELSLLDYDENLTDAVMFNIGIYSPVDKNIVILSTTRYHLENFDYKRECLDKKLLDSRSFDSWIKGG